MGFGIWDFSISTSFLPPPPPQALSLDTAVSLTPGPLSRSWSTTLVDEKCFMMQDHVCHLLHPAAWMLSLSQRSEQHEFCACFAPSSQTFNFKPYSWSTVVQVLRQDFKPTTPCWCCCARARIEYDFNEFGIPGKEKLAE